MNNCSSYRTIQFKCQRDLKKMYNTLIIDYCPHVWPQCVLVIEVKGHNLVGVCYTSLYMVA